MTKTGECHGCRLHNTTFGDLLARDPRAFGIEMIPAAFEKTPEMHFVLKGATMLGWRRYSYLGAGCHSTRSVIWFFSHFEWKTLDMPDGQFYGILIL